MSKKKAKMSRMDYDNCLKFIKENQKWGDLRDIAQITGLSQPYIWMVLNQHRDSEFVVRIARKFIEKRMKLMAEHTKSQTNS